MAFTIDLMVNHSEMNRVTKDTSTIISVAGELKQETSIIDPVILFAGSLSSLANCNYMYIASFNRYYFVTNIKSIRNGLIEISGHVDVLSSYASEIKSCIGIIERQANDWNLYLNDGTFKVYQNSLVVTKNFPSGFSGLEFVLAVAGS